MVKKVSWLNMRLNKILDLESHTPTPWLAQIRFTQISLTQLFKKNPDICT